MAGSDSLGPTKQKICRYCHQEIADGAKVCHHCNQPQQLFWQWFGRLSIFGTVLLVTIAFFELREAHKKNIAVADALYRAEDAKRIATSASRTAQEIEKNLNKFNEAFRDQLLLFTSVMWLELETKHEFGTGRAKKAADGIMKDLNSVLVHVIQDEQERAEWIKKLKQRIPARQNP